MRDEQQPSKLLQDKYATRLVLPFFDHFTEQNKVKIKRNKETRLIQINQVFMRGDGRAVPNGQEAASYLIDGAPGALGRP